MALITFLLQIILSLLNKTITIIYRFSFRSKWIENWGKIPSVFVLTMLLRSLLEPTKKRP